MGWGRLGALPPGRSAIDNLARRQYPEAVSHPPIDNVKDSIRGNSSYRTSHRRVPGASLGLTATSTPRLIRQVERGLSFKTLRTFASNTGIPISVITSIVGIPERTLARRKAAAKLTPDESERLLRVASVFEKTVELFEGDVTAAVKWLTTSRKALDNQAPLAYCRTELGAREVENLVGRLEHGVFS